jgi:DNA-nicking Smr family endonuclease
MSQRGRILTAEELALWEHVTRNVKRTAARSHRAPAAHTPDVAPAPAKVQPVAQAQNHTPPVTTPPPLTMGASHDMDRRTARRFARGDMVIDARLDLHGFSLDQAESAVTQFIRRAAAADHRCVLVVTGKGRRGSDGAFAAPRGRIRAEAPHWLNRPSLRPLILAVREAHFRHGGGGALYVLLKRRRDPHRP